MKRDALMRWGAGAPAATSCMFAAALLVGASTAVAQPESTSAPSGTPVPMLQASPAPALSGAASAVYRCPGNPVLYTDAISAREAREKGCRLLEGTPVTVIQTPKPRPAPAVSSAGPSTNGSRIDPADQRSRDSDARRILEAELRREEERLAVLKIEYNNGEPERMGNEKNFQKYMDRIADMKTAIARKESDIAALKRELAKQPQ